MKSLMLLLSKLTSGAAIALICVFPAQGLANGKALNELESAPAFQQLMQSLRELDSNSPVSGKLKVSFENVRGEGKKRKVDQGQANVFLTHGDTGLVMTYSPQLLDKMELEREAKIAKEDAKTPITSALNGVSMSSVNQTLSPVPSILRFLKSAKLASVSPVPGIEAEGRAAHRLEFVLPMEAVIDDKETRGYVDDFEGSLIIVTDKQGVPLSLKTKFAGDGRAYVFFKVSASGSTEQSFTVINGRLISSKREVFARFETTFGDGESYDLVEFIPQSVPASLSAQATLPAQASLVSSN